jgi:hypothetical protein
MERVKPGVTPELKTAMGAPKAPSYLVAYALVFGYGSIRITGALVVQSDALTKAQTHPGNPQAFLDDVLVSATRQGLLNGVNLAQRGTSFDVIGWQPYPVNGQTVLSSDDPNYTKTPRQA